MNSVVLEVVVGMALLYYITATLVSGVAEGITRLANVRSKTLWAALARMLDPGSSTKSSIGAPFMLKAIVPTRGGGRPAVTSASLAPPAEAKPPAAGGQVPDPNAPPAGAPQQEPAPQRSRDELLSELASLPSIRSLDYVTSGASKVASIPGNVFASALLELATIESSGGSVQAKLESLATRYSGSPLGTYLATLASQAGLTVDQVTAQVGSWFDAQMVRVSQTYRKNIKYVLAILGLLVAVLCNVDSVKVATALNGNADLRQVIAATAGTVKPEQDCTLEPPEQDATKKTLRCGLQDIASFDGTGVVVPMSDKWGERWSANWSSSNAPLHVLGLLLTTGAVALGGPMWFDFLMLLTGRKKSG